MKYLGIILSLLIFLQGGAFAKLGNKVYENTWQYGKELNSKQFSKSSRHFAGKKVYQLPKYGWQIETIFVNGKAISEAARPKGSKVWKKIITEREANVIADMLYPKKYRGAYKKQIKNAHFISHFFNNGVVSYEMKLDNRNKSHIGIIGVRTILYSNGDKFKDIKTNAYN